MSQEDLNSLMHKRQQIKDRLTRFKLFLSEDKNKTELIQIKTRLEKNVLAWDEFESVQTKIDILSTEPESTDARASFEEDYYDVITLARTLIDKIEKRSILQNVPIVNNSNNDQTIQNIKLPTLNLPTFTGEFQNWLFFYDTFNSLIHANATLTDIQKFHYLRSSLKGEASQVITALEVSADNYEVAWKLLKDRFQNKRLIIHNHVKALFELQSITKENPITLRQLLDNVQKHLRALKSLKEPVEQWHTLIIYLICAKLDSTTKREWESSIMENESPTMDDFTKFLTNRCQLLQTLDLNKPAVKSFQPVNIVNKQQNFNKNKNVEHTTAHVITRSMSCAFCKALHGIHRCNSLLNLPVQSRIEEIQKLNLCGNCLKKNHGTSEECKAGQCRVCNKKHNTLLHKDEISNTSQSSSQHSSQPSSQPSTSVVTHCSRQLKEHVLLSTALVYAYDNNGAAHECRVLLDSGSQSNFVTKRMCDLLNLPISKLNLRVTGINQSVTTITDKTEIKIKSRYNNFSKLLTFYVLPRITENLPSLNFDFGVFGIPPDRKLADPSFNQSRQIDMLLGANIFYELLCAGQIQLAKGKPVLQKTHFGWIISGSLLDNSYPTNNGLCHLTLNQKLEEQVTRFWQLEDYKEASSFTEEELACEMHFKNNTKRDQTGRFVVALPFRENVQQLGDSRQLAIKRLLSIERKFEKQPELKNAYSKFLKEYEELGHMTVVNAENEFVPNVFYLPHHAVLKPSSSTTKLRVVFDGSAKTSLGTSLNDNLMVGPTIQDDLVSIILRFRIYNYVLTADITKMYRQINVCEEDRNMQRILWRTEKQDPMRSYTLNTVTYGTAAAPFLAIRCLHELAHDNETQYPAASAVIRRNFYVDDAIFGSDTLEGALSLKRDLIKVLKSGGFELRKFMSNHEALHDTETQSNAWHMIDDQHTKTLGLLWKNNSDSLAYSLALQNSKNITKRSILSMTAQIFDPLGLISPITITAKLIIQKLWQLQLGWDESIPLDLHTRWFHFTENIDIIRELDIPRQVLCKKPDNIQLHGFCDASEAAYGACLYLRSIDDTGMHSRLLCSKSRVAPLKSISLPRLELCGALLLAELTNKIKQSLGIEINDIFYWCDSTITLAWISGVPKRWKTFVANRVAEIQQLTNTTSWRHVSSEDNPADLISRGVIPKRLLENQLWWHGPNWLQTKSCSWPNTTYQISDQIPEERNEVCTLVSINNDFSDRIFADFRELIKLQRAIAHCLRFKFNCLNAPDKRITTTLTVRELRQAIECLVKLVQNQSFQADIKSLKTTGRVNAKSSIASLCPFLDDKDLLRVGGRIKNADIEYSQKHPLLLPSSHLFTKLIVEHEHVQLLHAGTQGVLASLRLKYWPIAGRSTVKRILRQCITCFKAKPCHVQPVMGDLPPSRITPSRPFSTCGIDYAGPFLIKDGKTRSRKIVKSYLCLFVCFATKAVHLELVGDLTTEAFLSALKRFISRRGKCGHIYTDNGSNFLGAKKELKELSKLTSSQQYNDKIANYLSSLSIEWHLIPPRAPHFGGLWEAAIKSTKTHLKRIVGNAHLNYEEFYTLLVQIEACLNSRPLTPLSSDPNDLTPLTPGHFLIGDSLHALPQADLSNCKIQRLTRYQRVQHLLQHFWKRWSKEYLMELQRRSKWTKQSTVQLQPGAMVIIKDDNLPPTRWLLGRIVEVHPGQDGMVRVATVKTAGGVVTRAATKLCVLPVDTVQVNNV